MNASMVASHEQAVKHRRFIAATEADQENFERELGRNLYRRGKPLSECRTDYMAAGWLSEEARCESQYWLCMMREAN